MEKPNTPNYSSKYVQSFSNFDETKLKDLKRTFTPTEDEIYTLPKNNKLAFDPATKKMTSFTKAEIEDKIEALDEVDENYAFGEPKDLNGFVNSILTNIRSYKEDIKVMVNNFYRSGDNTKLLKSYAEYQKLMDINDELNRFTKVLNEPVNEKLNNK